LTMIFGKISLDGLIRVENISFPSAYLKGKGPRFGIEGVRKKVAEPKNPLTMAIFKPCVGLTPQELALMFFELASGGMHLVKDDEILPDLAICPVEKRLEACLHAGERARKQTKRRTLYAVNLTGPVSQLLSKARRLAKLGAECFLFNVLSYGYGALEELKQVGVPIMAHPALAGGWCGSPDTGMSYRVVLGSLMRLGGADIVLFPSSYGTVALPSSETNAIREALTQPMGPLRRSFPGPSAGIHPGLVPQLLNDYGRDVIINAGGGVHGHPQGARAGARAFQQAVERALRKQDFKTLPESEAPELAKALQLWGNG
jgi:2,3-diketo-5-methylthiopentyl-1-phosphate enolase